MTERKPSTPESGKPFPDSQGAPTPPIDPEGLPERTGPRHTEALLMTGALQSAIFNSANFSSIATDAKGVIQIFNVGAERMLGYTAGEVVNKITLAVISDPQEVIVRAKALRKVQPTSPSAMRFGAPFASRSDWADSRVPYGDAGTRLRPPSRDMARTHGPPQN